MILLQNVQNEASSGEEDVFYYLIEIHVSKEDVDFIKKRELMDLARVYLLMKLNCKQMYWLI
jgi:hypothetical protein